MARKPDLKLVGGAFSGGDDGGTVDVMEARVSKLEDKTDRLQDTANAIRIDLARIEGRLNAMPTTIQLIGFVIAIFVAAGILKYFGN